MDSILIDEARTPLIISGPSEESTDKYYKINRIIPKLIRGEVIEGKEPGEKYTTGDYTIDEKHKSAALTEEGVLHVEKLLNVGNLYDPQNIEWNHHVQQALRAHVLYQRDREYVIRDGDEGPEVVIVDEFTGRLMPGRRWSDGLHQAVEAKEGVKIERENQTLATITFQNYFRMYKKLAGMTGTAETEAAEFDKIYKLEVVVIPTNKTMIRQENTDMVYRTEVEKFRNAAKEIKEYNAKGQPVLVGTISVQKSEHLAAILKTMGVKHEVLNAKNHEREAGIVSQAGRKNAVTVSTNMAGRGTDILLGGNPEFMTKDECLKKKWPSACPRKMPSSLPTSTSTTSPITNSSIACAATCGTSSTPPTRRTPIRNTTKWLRSAACISSPPSAMNPAASTTSFVDVPAAMRLKWHFETTPIHHSVRSAPTRSVTALDLVPFHIGFNPVDDFYGDRRDR